ncbi:hypothetical protein YC2023_055320 [Brassica napus]
MASTFFLGHTQKLTLPFSNFTSTDKPTLRSQNPFLSFPSNGSQSGRLFIRSPIMMAKSNSKSEYKGDKKLLKPLKMVAGASLALACALSIFGFKINNMNYTAAAAAHPSAADMISGSQLQPYQHGGSAEDERRKMRGGGAAPSRHKHAIQNEPEADFNVQMALVEILILLVFNQMVLIFH